MTLETRATELVVARYGELWLKGRNRVQFERRLVANAHRALAEVSEVEIERGSGQIVVTPATRASEVAARLREVFGISSVSLARRAEPQPDAIADVAREVLAAALESRPRGAAIPFRVETRRADKTFPLVSTELDRYVADRVMPDHGERLRVDLSHPELTLGIHVQPGRAFVFAGREAGAGGLPVGSVGRVVCLLSGGIDSPVAAWLAMKRGCEVVFVTFHSYPYIGASYLQKVTRLVRSLGRFQPRSRLLQVPFAPIQTAIRDGCPASYRTVLYRRMMQRIAARLAGDHEAGAVVTGDSLGQVASQTLENMACIEDASDVAVLRPLVTYDKAETIELARRIGTFEISIEPEPDCCTVFQPRRPVLRGRVEVCRDAESTLDVESLVREAVAASEVVDV